MFIVFDVCFFSVAISFRQGIKEDFESVPTLAKAANVFFKEEFKKKPFLAPSPLAGKISNNNNDEEEESTTTTSTITTSTAAKFALNTSYSSDDLDVKSGIEMKPPLLLRYLPQELKPLCTGLTQVFMFFSKIILLLLKLLLLGV